MNYAPSPTGLAFMNSRAFIKLICGPVGGGKSTAALMGLWMMALQQRVFEGVRRTKFIILRNTMSQLRDTVKPLINQWFLELPSTPIGVWRASDHVFEIRIRLPDGSVVHTELMMLAADTPDDVRRLLSVEASAAWVEEAREVDPDVFSGLQGRVNRFPNQDSGGVSYPCVICSTNPPPVGTFWHELMTHPGKRTEIFMQPPAMLDDGTLNPAAENLAHLAPSYYENLMEDKTDDWITVYLKNRYGAGGMGQPVFRGTFKRDFHVAKSPLLMINASMKRIIVGSDNGLTAAAVIGQEDAKGRIRLLREAFVSQGETMGYDRFLELKLMPVLRDLGVAPANVLFVVDPACFSRGEANETTIAMEIKKRGFEVRKASTNTPERRISAVEGLLVKQIEGGPHFVIDPGMTHTIAALEWGYRNRKSASDQGKAEPEKNFWSHVADAVQYFALYYNGVEEGAWQVKAREIQRHPFAYT